MIPSNTDAEIDSILEGYKSAPPAAPPQGITPPSIDTGAGSAFEPAPFKAAAAPLPFITHDASQAPKVGNVDVYVRGPKKGQPKPPKKGQAPPLNEAGQLSIQATTFITGAVFVTMLDMVIPLFIVGIYNFIQSRKDKKGTFKPLDYEKVQISKKQKDDLGMVADAVVRELKLSGSPSLLFFLGLAGAYFMNFILVKSLAENERLKDAGNAGGKNESNH